MLRTDERALLVDLLTPPEPGYRLERAVGTTFTLHLQSLLRIPLAVVGSEWHDGADPLGVMEAVRSEAWEKQVTMRSIFLEALAFNYDHQPPKANKTTGSGRPRHGRPRGRRKGTRREPN